MTHKNPQDPFEPLNRTIYKFNDTVDRAVLKPVTKVYTAVVPAVGRMMIGNFFSNINDIIVVANDLLQLKFKQAASDTGRVVVNSTVGLFGLVDVASQVGLEKHNEDLGQTLGHWGIGPGPYLMLPFIGPSSVRDGIGYYGDSYLGIWSVDEIETRNQLLAGYTLNQRAKLMESESLLEGAVLDRYSFIRDAYLQRRLSLVHDGNPPRQRIYDEEDDDEEDIESDLVSSSDQISPEVSQAASDVVETLPATSDQP